RIDRDEWFASPRTQLMNRLRDQLLARTTLTLDDDRARYRRDLLDLEQHFADGLGLPDQSCRFGESPAVENAPHREVQFIRRNGLRVDVGEADRAQPIAQPGIFNISEPNHRGAIPQLIAHDLHIAGIAEVAGENDEI